ncbi:MAG: MoaD/ThiS family protein [Desulfobacteraceae bacterium]|nr:MAG: MoaD/ThiS family protein [Desulfobacteraceae bacterium]
MKININLFATLSPYLPENSEAYTMEPDTRLDTLITRLGIPQEQVKLVFVNGKRQELSYVLDEGDRVGVFPPVGGG